MLRVRKVAPPSQEREQGDHDAQVVTSQIIVGASVSPVVGSRVGDCVEAAVGGKAVQEGALGTRVDGGNDGLTLGCEVGADVGGGVHI
jgi:hypothetical protein